MKEPGGAATRDTPGRSFFVNDLILHPIPKYKGAIYYV